MHLILRLLTYQDVIDYVLPSFSIYVDEKDELKFKFLHKCFLVVEYICIHDFESAIDHIVIHVFPHLESILCKVTSEDLQETCLNTLAAIFEKIEKRDAAPPLNNMIASLVSDLK